MRPTDNSEFRADGDRPTPAFYGFCLQATPHRTPFASDTCPAWPRPHLPFLAGYLPPSTYHAPMPRVLKAIGGRCGATAGYWDVLRMHGSPARTDADWGRPSLPLVSKGAKGCGWRPGSASGPSASTCFPGTTRDTLLGGSNLTRNPCKLVVRQELSCGIGAQPRPTRECRYNAMTGPCEQPAISSLQIAQCRALGRLHFEKTVAESPICIFAQPEPEPLSRMGEPRAYPCPTVSGISQ